MSDYIIETGIPIPISRSMYPFDRMAVGDSFSVPLSPEAVNRLRAAVVGYQHRNREKNSAKKFSIYQMREENTVRVWRTA